MIRSTNLIDSYKVYRKMANANHYSPVYLKVVSGLYEFIMEKVRDGHSVELGGGKNLGVIGIHGKKQKVVFDDAGEVVAGLSVDWKETYKLRASSAEAREKKEVVYHLNSHTNGVKYSHYWHMEGMKITHKRVYSLIFCRTNKREAAAGFKAGKEYLVKLK